MGNLLAVVVHEANIHDTEAGISLAGAAFKIYPASSLFRVGKGRSTSDGKLVESSERILS